MLNHYKNLPKNSVICLMSPTASGKTDLACKLYQTGNFDIISVDSALVYQDMDIGTAKPSKQALIDYPHALVDILDPTQNYSVADFVQDVKILIDNAHHNNKIPLLVGGTMMYYMALFDGISSVPQTNESIRQKVQLWRHQEGNQALFDYLKQHDPSICQKLTVNDTQRITRAVEVHIQTGIAMSVYQATPKIALAHNKQQCWCGICVMPDRAWLHERIACRLDSMWQAGFVDEVIDIVNKYPVTMDMPSMRSVGYRQVLEYLVATNNPRIDNSFLKNWLKLPQNQVRLTDFCTDFDKNACQVMKNKALYATRQLAKRQYTWLRQLVRFGLPTNMTSHHNNIKMSAYHSIQQVEQLIFGE